MTEPGSAKINQALNDLFASPIRLKICGYLAPLAEIEFMLLRDQLAVSDSVLSKHVKQLTDAGYTSLRRGSWQGRKRTWVRLTSEGREALGRHIDALKQIAANL